MYNVFIVDDEPFILEGLPAVIPWGEYGAEIVGQASDGLEAFEAMQSVPVDILITDITMPEMDGLELIRKVKEQQPDIKFIILSGYDEFDYVKEGMKLGIENYLLKPVNIEELKETVRSTVQKLEDRSRKELVAPDDLDILRDNIVYRWVTDAIHPEELKHRSQLLGVRLDFPYYVVSAVKILDAQRSSVIAEISRLSKQLAEQAGSCVYFRDVEGDILFIFGEREPEADKLARYKLLEQLRADIQQSLGLTVVITVGSVGSTFLNASRSYADAKRLQEYYLVRPANEIIDYEHIHSEEDNTGPEAGVPIDFEAFDKLFFTKNKAELFSLVNEVFAGLTSREGISPKQIQNCAVQMIIHVKELVKNISFSNELASDYYRELFSLLFQIQTIDQLKEHVKHVAGIAVDYLAAEEDELSPVIRQVLKQVSANYSEELSLKTLGQSLNINSVYLGQLFQRETNESFSDYLNKFRIEKAKNLLANTQLKTNEISAKVGYVEPSYFYKQFKKYTGISPTDYRSSF